MSKAKTAPAPTAGTTHDAAETRPSGNGAKKTACPVTAKQFLTDAPKAIKVDLGVHGNVVAGIKEFSSGSFGYYAGDKVTIQVGGVPVKFQMTMSLVAVGSKDAAKE